MKKKKNKTKNNTKNNTKNKKNKKKKDAKKKNGENYLHAARGAIHSGKVAGELKYMTPKPAHDSTRECLAQRELSTRRC